MNKNHVGISTDQIRTNKGITLVAVVITIIVLLILAGVAISMLSGENGILKQAAKAKTEKMCKNVLKNCKKCVKLSNNTVKNV